jgi:hypothetical protein
MRHAGIMTRSSKQSKMDINETAFSIVQQATGQIPKQAPPIPHKKITKAVTLGQAAKNGHRAEPDASEISRVMAALGRRGGKIGGKNRAKALSKSQRSEIALKAARARWDNKKDAS